MKRPRDGALSEVQLPFMQYLKIDKKFVFICMGDQGIEACSNICDALLKATKSLGRRALVLASSDFNHYESAEIGEKKDRQLFECLKGLD